MSLLLAPIQPYRAESLAEIIDRLHKDAKFAYDFADTVKMAMGGNPIAQGLVAQYFQPSQRDLDSFGIPAAAQGPYNQCTDVGKLILVTCKQVAPYVFP
jgi:hypothetical protein